MKHHSQRSKRPPSRTLAPRILTALAAGAVPLGALPSAYTDDVDDVVISSVTEDLIFPRVNADVVGSLDGSSATITIGRTGYGTTPRIFMVYSPGKFARWCVATGALLDCGIAASPIRDGGSFFCKETQQKIAVVSYSDDVSNGAVGGT
ncbi:hypothetical protein [uncultured Selenomonas sp.]|uniref:hypothetical protein n=1 Tax=uncultured Selenomonas sp. TaxID=159275 RepID=UPI0028E5877F|nr:hypothetical protein [uncultured Selenomonas sp.]